MPKWGVVVSSVCCCILIGCSPSRLPIGRDPIVLIASEKWARMLGGIMVCATGQRGCAWNHFTLRFYGSQEPVVGSGSYGGVIFHSKQSFIAETFLDWAFQCLGTALDTCRSTEWGKLPYTISNSPRDSYSRVM